MRVACVAAALAMLLGCSKDGAVAESLPSTSTSSSTGSAVPTAVRTAPRTYTPRRNAKRGLNPRRSSKGDDSRAQLLSFFANVDGTLRVNTYEEEFSEGELILNAEAIWVYEVEGNVTTADAYRRISPGGEPALEVGEPEPARKAEWKRILRDKYRIERDRVLQLQTLLSLPGKPDRDDSPTVPFVVTHWPIAKGDRREATHTRRRDGQVVRRIRTILEVGLKREVNGRVFVGCVREELKKVRLDGAPFVFQFVSCPGVGILRYESWNSSGEKMYDSKLKKTGSVIPPEIKALR